MVNNDPVLWAMVNAFKDVDKRFAENIMKFETMKNGIEELRQDMREAKRAIASLQEKVEILDEQNKKISNENSQMKAALCSLSKKFIFCR
jgi:chromosome segregation ATPase